MDEGKLSGSELSRLKEMSQMKLFKNITFGDDQSKASDTAWGWICAQNWPEWSVDVITVQGFKLQERETSEDAYQLHEWTPPTERNLPASTGISEIRYLTAKNDPRLILGECTDTDLIVVGPRGKGLLKAMHIGSTAEALLRCPNAPLVIARQSEKIDSVLACIDGSVHADYAVNLLAAMPWIKGVTVYVLGVVEVENEIRSKVSAAAKVLSAAGAKVIEKIAEPDPLAITVSAKMTILDHIDDLEPDLVALGTRGMTGLPRVLVGSVASAIAHYAKSSVLLAHDWSVD
jgi:nucleotide-binding universal stress UspA family protein